MRRPEAIPWWLVLLFWAIFLALAAAALSSYLDNGAGFFLASFVMYLFLPTGVTVVTFLSRARNPQQGVVWVSTPTIYLATTLPMFLFVALTIAAVLYELWSGGISLVPTMMLVAAVLSFLGALVSRVLEITHVRKGSLLS